MHSILDKHQTIAWDHDHTLIGGPNSDFFRAYIDAHPKKSHYIVTFRNDFDAKLVLGELEYCGMNTKNIISVHNIPQAVSISYNYWFQNHEVAISQYCARNNISREHFATMAESMPYWKGLKAFELGCTVLIDDMEDLVLPGCDKHGIEFLHSFHPIR